MPPREKPDALDEMIAEFSAEDRKFPALLAAAGRRRMLLQELADHRRAMDLSQTEVAAAMRTSQPSLARLETIAGDTKLSTLERYAAALGYVVEYHLVRASRATLERPVVVKR